MIDRKQAKNYIKLNIYSNQPLNINIAIKYKLSTTAAHYSYIGVIPPIPFANTPASLCRVFLFNCEIEDIYNSHVWCVSNKKY